MPCGTSEITSIGLDYLPSTTTLCFLPRRMVRLVSPADLHVFSYALSFLPSSLSFGVWSVVALPEFLCAADDQLASAVSFIVNFYKQWSGFVI